jgi:hypothetical protein
MSWRTRKRGTSKQRGKKFQVKRKRSGRFLGQRFEKCSTHTSVNKSKFPIGSIWYDKASQRYGRVVGYPLNDYYHDDYIGMCYFDEAGRYNAYGASRSTNLKTSKAFPSHFRPKGEPKD